MFNELYVPNGMNKLTHETRPTVTIPGDKTTICWGEDADGNPTPVYVSIASWIASKYTTAIDNKIKTARTYNFYFHLCRNTKANTGDLIWVFTTDYNVSNINNIFASNLHSYSSITNSDLTIVKTYYFKCNTVFFNIQDGNWYKHSQFSGPTSVTAPETTSGMAPTISIEDFSISQLNEAYGKSVKNYTEVAALNNSVTALTEEVDRVESVVADIDIEAIRAELNEEINRVNTALGAINSVVNEKEAQLELKIQETETRMNNLIDDAEQDLQDMVNSFNSSFSEEIVNTKEQLQQQLQNAITELQVLKSEVESNIQDIRDTVNDLVDDVEGTMRSVVTDIALTR